MIGSEIKEIFVQNSYIKSVYYGTQLIWTKVKDIISSCYGSGRWIGNLKWTSNDKWKSN